MLKTYVKYDVYWSDHYPLVVECDLNVIKQKILSRNVEPNKVVWGIRTMEQINAYRSKCDEGLKAIDFPGELQTCSHGCCDRGDHQAIIEDMYREIVSVLRQATSETCERETKSRKTRSLAGWNRHVGDAYWNARQRFKIWLQYGKPSSGPIYTDMVDSKKVFKGKLKWCENHQEQIRMDMLARHHLNADFRNFWKCTNQLNLRPGTPVSIDGVSSPKDIANVFVDHFAVGLLVGCSMMSPRGLS